MKTKNALIIGTLLASSLYAAAFADDTANGVTAVTTAAEDSTSTGSDDTNTGAASIPATTEISTGITLTGTTSTGVTSTGIIADDKVRIDENRGNMISNWSKFREDYGFIKQFVKKPETKAEAKTVAAQLKADLKSYHEAVKALIKEGQSAIKANSFDPVAFNTKASELFSKNVGTLSGYVDPAKMEAFERFMDEKKAVILANRDLKKENFQLKQKIIEIKKKIFSEKQREAIANRLVKKEKGFLERLMKVIDVYQTKAKSEKLKSQLEELKEITKERLEALK